MIKYFRRDGRALDPAGGGRDRVYRDGVPAVPARSSAGAKLAENSIDYSLAEHDQECLYLPTSREAKYKAKQANDAFFSSGFGDVLSAGLVFAGTQLAWLQVDAVRPRERRL